MVKPDQITGGQKIIANSYNLTQNDVEGLIFLLRDKHVILDRDLAKLYGTETKRLNEQVRRNPGRFPDEFVVQLTKEEWLSLRSQNATLNGRGRHPKYLPYAFTEYGVIMAAAVLKTEIADKVSVTIVRAFVAMRRFMLTNAQVFQRLDRIEYKQLETDQKIDQVFAKLEEKTESNNQCIFFDGQIYDAYEFICDLIRRATKRIVLIDNYVDDSVLTMLDKRGAGVEATIYTKEVGNQFELDLEKHNAQYAAIPVFVFRKSHDRFLIIDDKVYHVGASLKDLGKKWFAVSLMEAQDAGAIISRLEAEATSFK
jgi:hypothetical protein